MPSTTTVLVTGASGYIACHIVKLLLEKGYNVRGTVRNLNDSRKCDPLYNLAKDSTVKPKFSLPNFGRAEGDAENSMSIDSADQANNSTTGWGKLTLVEADLTKADGWNEAVQGCQYVIHTASPFPADVPKNPDDVIQPALDGTLTVLRACKDAQSVKRVVLTSSLAAIMGQAEKSTDYDENDWTNIDSLDRTSDAYMISKTLAEKAAWKFVEDEKNPFELAVINPGFVMGPLLQNAYCTSLEFLKRLMNFEAPILPRINLPVADVRDVAEAHVKAMTCLEAAGHRHLIATSTVTLLEVATILKQEFRPQGYRISTIVAPYCVFWLASFWDKSVKLLLPYYDKFPTCDNSRIKKTLGIEPTKMEDTILDMAYSLIDRGFVKKTSKYVPKNAQ
uniref:NAD-dependent epimerase/dehydratase domain-containing protein n=1 Tax=Romanomermis culicivorax TaxID=13658 RepID=A0A915KTZ6_ROMCU